MSPSSYGFFVHVFNHQVIRVHDHAIDACSGPGFGLPEDLLSHLDPIRDRIEVLVRVLSEGWIRVRHRKDQVSIEFLTEWLPTLEAVAQSIDEMGIGELCWLDFHHLARDESLSIAANGLQRHFETGTTFDLLRRVQMRIEPDGGQFDE